MKGAALVLCLIVIAIPVYVRVHSSTSVSLPNLEWLGPVNHVFLILLYAALGIWAFGDLRTAQTRMRRGLLKSILIDIGIIWTIDVFVWMKPDFGEALPYIVTTLAYLLALLVICALLIDSRTKQTTGEHSDLKAG
jgi:hypothetical protein